MEPIVMTWAGWWQISPYVVGHRIFKLFSLPVDWSSPSNLKLTYPVGQSDVSIWRTSIIFIDIYVFDSWSITHYYTILHENITSVSPMHVSSRVNIKLGTTACYSRIIKFKRSAFFLIFNTKCHHECDLVRNIPSWVHPATVHDQIRYKSDSRQIICKIVSGIIRDFILRIIHSSLSDDCRKNLVSQSRMNGVQNILRRYMCYIYWYILVI